MHLAETGLCGDGEQEALIQSGATRIGGRLPVNTDGGCLAYGEPIGASGPAAGARGRAAAPRRGRRAAGPGRAAGGLHPGLRGTRSQRVHRPQHVSTLAGLLDRGRSAHPERTALVFGGEQRTHAALHDRAARLGAALAAGGVRPRRPRRAAAAQRARVRRGAGRAAIGSGACAVPINFRLTSDEVAYILEDSGATALIAGVRPAGLPRLPFELDTGPAYEAAIAGSDPAPQADLHEDDPALLCYTSGTTGRPKGAILSHGNLVAATLSWIHEMRAAAGRRVALRAAALPHRWHQRAAARSSRSAATSIVTPTTGFDPALAVRLIEQHAVTMCIFVPDAVGRRLRHARRTRIGGGCESRCGAPRRRRARRSS